MDDTRYTFVSDIREKKSTARGARHRVCGAKSKKCTLPHENLTPAQMKRRNGPVKTYSCSQPCTYEEFKDMPEKIQWFYIDTCLNKFGGSTSKLAAMWGVTTQCVRVNMKRLGIKRDKKPGSDELWQEFLAKGDTPEEEVTQEVTEPVEIEETPEVPATPEEVEPEAPVFSVIRNHASIHLNYTGTPYQVFNFLLNCGIGADDDSVFDIDITLTGREEA